MRTPRYIILSIKYSTLIFSLLIYNTAFGIFNPERDEINLQPKTDQNSSNSESGTFSAFQHWEDQTLSYTKNEQRDEPDYIAGVDPKYASIIKLPTFQVQALPFFPKIYTGNGVDHMNINLVSLSQTGILEGDEIGVFDGIYCVGSIVIKDKNIAENNASIPASANDTIESQPNGFIDGHKITLKLYRAGTVYALNFQTVNGSQDIFVRAGSMFALVDFSQTTNQSSLNQKITIKMYPNPFNTQLVIEIGLPLGLHVKVQIFNQNGLLVRNLFNGISTGQMILNWDGKDNNQNQVGSGTYYCKINENTTKILYNLNNQ